jgi:hypothetical protein
MWMNMRFDFRLGHFVEYKELEYVTNSAVNFAFDRNNEWLELSLWDLAQTWIHMFHA